LFQYLERDPSLAPIIIEGIYKYWPTTNTNKELLLLSELEELILNVEEKYFILMIDQIFERLSNSISCTHFRVSERALYFFNNEQFVKLIKEYLDETLPLLFDSLYEASQFHWSPSIRKITKKCLYLFKELDEKLFNCCLYQYKETLKIKTKNAMQLEVRRKKLEETVNNQDKTVENKPNEEQLVPSTNSNISSVPNSCCNNAAISETSIRSIDNVMIEPIS